MSQIQPEVQVHENVSHIHAQTTRLDTLAFLILLVTLIISPLVVASLNFTDALKTVIISLGVLIPAILYSVIAYKEKKFALPPQRILVTGGLLVVSILLSSIFSSHFIKSFFGRGFELTSGSFLIILLLASTVAYVTVQ
nr:hypothetical protein [bacterium]